MIRLYIILVIFVLKVLNYETYKKLNNKLVFFNSKYKKDSPKLVIYASLNIASIIFKY